MIPTASAHKLEIITCSTYSKLHCIRVVTVAIALKMKHFVIVSYPLIGLQLETADHWGSLCDNRYQFFLFLFFKGYNIGLLKSIN